MRTIRRHQRRRSPHGGAGRRLNQACSKNVGFLNPLLYSAADAIDDVTSGTNAITGTLPGYDAGPGWDACTGMGTPDGTALLAALQAN